MYAQSESIIMRLNRSDCPLVCGLKVLCVICVQDTAQILEKRIRELRSVVRE